MTKMPRLLIAAPHSGSGKTTIVCGLLAAMKKRGLEVNPFKIGPDYIDTGWHTAACGRAASNLDTWLMTPASMKSMFLERAALADISVTEGVMGLYDGGRDGVSSTAEISKLLKIPVVLVIDAKSMGESAAAIALGFRQYDSDVDIRGVILNRLGSETHRQMICEAMDKIDMPVLGALFRDEGLRLPERHLGLLPTHENSDAEAVIKRLGEISENSLDIGALIKIAESAPDIDIHRLKEDALSRIKSSVKIGVARDEAFSFYYPESLAVLEEMGAEIVYFSPLRDSALPQVSGLIFGGGFPEIFAAQLSANRSMLAAVKRAAEAGMPIYAECGGYMYLTEELIDFDDKAHAMAGVIPHKTKMNKQLQTVGYVEAEALHDTILCPAGAVMRGHEFHFSSAASTDAKESPAFLFRKNRTNAVYTGGYATSNVLASYLHTHFAGATHAAAHFLRKCGNL